MRINKRSILSAVVAALLGASTTGCHIYKKYETPSNTAITAEYVKAREQSADSTVLGNMLWENVFTDPVLADLINRALINNTNLQDAKINVDIANAQLKGARMAFAPSLTLAPNGSGSSIAGSRLSWGYQLPATLSWEIDVFGKLLNSKRQADVNKELAEAVAQATRSQIICGVANTYYAMSALQAQLDLSRNTARLWQESVQTMRDLKEAGRLTEAAVVQSDANYRSVLAAITQLEVQRHQLDNTMSLLLNTMPQHFEVAPDAILSLDMPAANGIPMAWLAARPDVTAAERRMATAYYATNLARSAFYPSLNISVSGGFTNQLGTMIKNPGEWFLNLAGQLTAPLFARGQNITRLKVTKLQQQQALNGFERTVLSAAGEVSDALTVYNKANERQVYLQAQVADLEKSVEYTNDILVYANGTYLEVLTAQQSLLQAQTNLITCRLNRTQAIISMYQATGGGR